eukprot:scaffold355_cov161-Skeletonema_marinoi.AAC.3
MVFIQGSLSQYDVPRLAEEEGIQITQLGGRYTDEDWEILAEVLQGTTSLNSLQFDNCSVIALRNSAKALAAVLIENSTIEDIDLETNHIGNEGTKALAEALKYNNTLTRLNLADNEISDSGARALAAALKVNSSLQDLRLGFNRITDKGAVAMAEALQENSTLNALSLDGNKIGERGAEALLNSLQQNDNLSMEYISLEENKMTTETLENFEEEMVRIKNSIRTVGVDEGQVVAEEDIAEAEEPSGDDIKRPSNETGQLTIGTANTLGDDIDEDAQTNRERDREKETEINEQELQSTIARLQRELAEKEEENASKNAILKKIGMMANGKDGDGDALHAESGGSTDKEAKAKLMKIGEMVNGLDEDAFNQDDEDEEEEGDPQAKRLRTESGRSNEQSNRANRSKARKIQVKHENIKAGDIKCPDPACGRIISHGNGCKVLICRNHQPQFLYFCAHCKKIGERGSEIIRCDCPYGNTQDDRDVAQEMRNQRSRDNPELVD